MFVNRSCSMLRLCRLLVRAGLRQVSTVQDVPSQDGIGGTFEDESEFYDELQIHFIGNPRSMDQINLLGPDQGKNIREILDRTRMGTKKLNNPGMTRTRNSKNFQTTDRTQCSQIPSVDLCKLVDQKNFRLCYRCPRRFLIINKWSSLKYKFVQGGTNSNSRFF